MRARAPVVVVVMMAVVAVLHCWCERSLRKTNRLSAQSGKSTIVSVTERPNDGDVSSATERAVRIRLDGPHAFTDDTHARLGNVKKH